MFNYSIRLTALLLFMALLHVRCSHSDNISKSVTVCEGAVNGVIVEKGGKKLVIYGDPYNDLKKSDMILFTHFRRDVIWAGRSLVQSGSYSVAPAGEKDYFTGVDSLWTRFSESRFHDYYCQTTRVGITPLNVDRFVSGGDILKWEGIDINVLNTPGYTRSAVSYLAEIDGNRIAFTGDLIYGDGKIFDLYSFQDSFKEIGGYHGYATRLGMLISSLQLIAEQKPDIIIPSRGPVIHDPVASINKLIEKVRSVYQNYLSISAYRWYFPERMKTLAEHVLGPESKADWMPYSAVIRNEPPEWYLHVSNSNLVLAEDSTAFLIDCGTTDAYEAVLGLKKSGRIKAIDGIFITHYHDDHTEYINEVVKEFGCPVYVTEELKDILENPGAYQMPCLTAKPIRNLTIMEDGQKMDWKDFTVTFHYFPGQTIYHDAVLFRKDGGEAIFFIGDSFTPSGIDDYCLLNRNLLSCGTGYFYCLDILKNLTPGTLLANQHVEPPFTYSAEQIDFMISSLAERNLLFKDLFPWENINYGVDEQWAKVYPYGQKAKPGDTLELSVRIFNHTDLEKTFIVEPNFNNILTGKPGKTLVNVSPRTEGQVKYKIKVEGTAPQGVSPLSFNIKSDMYDLREWCEALIDIKK